MTKGFNTLRIQRYASRLFGTSAKAEDSRAASFQARHASYLGDQDRLARKVLGELRVCIKNQRFRPADVKVRNLELVTTALADAGISYFMVDNISRHRYRVGVLEKDRRSVIAALRDVAGRRPLYVRPGRISEDATFVFFKDWAGTDAALSRDVPIIRIYEYYATPRSGLILGARYGCDVEFWSEEDDVLVAPTRNRAAEAIPVDFAGDRSVVIEGKTYPTTQAFTGFTHASDFDFPIDVVYTWVDGEDPQWRMAKDRAMEELRDDTLTHALGTNRSRFHNKDELRYSLRSLSLYAPFVRHVFLVTADQVPPWLNTASDRLTVVSHKEIFGDVGTLPTFNSHAIESRLHHIEGLSEHYLYVNDDVFFGRFLSPELFFTPTGLHHFYLSMRLIPLGPPHVDDLPVETAAKNGRALLLERFGRVITQRMKHTPHPQQRSIQLEMEAAWPEHFARVASRQFRSTTDISAASSLNHYYAYFTKRAVPRDIEYVYVDLSDEAALEERLALLKARNLDVFCLNDTDTTPEDEEGHARRVDDFLERYFPLKSEFEI